MSKLFLFVIASVFFLGACSVKPIATLQPEFFTADKHISNPIAKSLIDSLLKVHKIDGVSIAYINNKDEYWAQGYGYADAKHKILINANTSFQAAEISQTLAVYALFNLIQAKKIDLDTDLREYLDEFNVPNNFPDSYLAIRNLLKHRAGINVSEFESYVFSDSLPNSDQLLHGIAPAKNKAIQVVYEPLKTLSYSEGSFQIIQRLIEKIMRESYESYINNNVFYPLKMENSSFTYPINKENMSDGFISRKRPIKGGYNLYPQAAAEGLWTSASDLAKFVDNLIWAVRGKSLAVNHENSLEMVTNQFGVNYKEENMRISFKGSNEGFTTHFVASIKNTKGIVVMVNSPDAEAFINDIYRLIH